MSHLRIEGELIGDPPVIPDRWRTQDGMEVSLAGSRVIVEWPVAPSPTNGNRMQSEVEDRLLVSVLRNVTPRRVRWQSSTEVLPDGRSLTLFAPSVGVAWNSRNVRTTLSQLDAEAAVLRAEPDLAEALRQLRITMQLWQSDNRAALSRLYLTAEAIVFAVCGDTERDDWDRCSRALRVTQDCGQRLYLSLQAARHVRATKANARLQHIGASAMNPGECLNAVLALLDAYLARQLATSPVS